MSDTNGQSGSGRGIVRSGHVIEQHQGATFMDFLRVVESSDNAARGRGFVSASRQDVFQPGKFRMATRSNPDFEVM